MLKNYFKVAIRNFFRQSGFSLINVLGLASGMAICMLILTLINSQNDYDQFHEKKDRIFRIICDRTSDHDASFATVPHPLFDELIGKEAVVENGLRIRDWFGGDAVYGEKTNSIGGLYAEASLFEIFDFTLEYGDEKTALSAPYSIVLTPEAVALFGMPENPIGEVLEFKDLGAFTVKGVIKVPEGKTHIDYGQVIASYASVRPLEQAEKIPANIDDWKGTDDTFIYLLLNKTGAARQLNAKLKNISDRVYADEENYRLDFKLQALDAVAPVKMLHNDLFFTIPEVALVFLSILAIIVLLTAFFNYTNLSVARGLGRAVEVGVRKVIGARRSQVFLQFTCEAIVVALVSLVLALGLLEVLIFPAFEQLSFARYLALKLELNNELYLKFFAFSLVVGFVAGLLPATYLSAFQPVQVMKKLKNIKVFGRLGWRKALIVVQFVIALIFLITITILFDQTQYMLAKDMGFDQENLINMRLSGNELSKVKASMSTIPGVKSISGTSIIPATGSNHGIYFKQIESAEVKEANRLWVDDQFIDTWGLELVAGRNFLPISDSLNRGIIINEKAVEFLGWKSNQEAIGQPLLLDVNSESGGYEASIIGVIKDFHYLTLDKGIGSLFLVNDPGALYYANIKIQTDDIRGTLADIEAAWKKLDPVHGVSYIFMDEELGEQLSIFYDLFKILGFLAAIAIFITCLGFLGIAAYSVEIRTKEIGIRKILGAGLNRIIWILSKGLLYPLLIAIVVAIPLAFVVNNLWLNQFAFRVQFSLFNMGLGILFMGLISALILLSQSYRIARQNPVESLRVE